MENVSGSDFIKKKRGPAALPLPASFLTVAGAAVAFAFGVLAALAAVALGAAAAAFFAPAAAAAALLLLGLGLLPPASLPPPPPPSLLAATGVPALRRRAGAMLARGVGVVERKQGHRGEKGAVAEAKAPPPPPLAAAAPTALALPPRPPSRGREESRRRLVIMTVVVWFREGKHLYVVWLWVLLGFGYGKTN